MNWEKFNPFDFHGDMFPIPQNHLEYQKKMAEQFQSALSESVSPMMKKWFNQNGMDPFPFNTHKAAKTEDTKMGNEQKRNKHQKIAKLPGAKMEDKKSFPYRVFDLHEKVVVQITIQDSSRLKNIKVFHTSHQLIIKESARKEIIPLPALVEKKGAATSYKNGTLEISLCKKIDDQYTEIDVHEI